jgi:membrane protease YdiL (CAAX protease family)
MITENKPLIQQGWLRAMLYILLSLSMVYVTSAILGRIITRFGLAGAQEEDMPIQGILLSYSVVTVVLITMAFLFRKLIDKQSVLSMGFRWKGYGKHAAAGFFLGILLLSAGALVLVLLQFLFFTSAEFHPGELLLSLLFFIIVAFTEEIAFRGYILNNLLQSTNKWTALIVSSLLFSLFHAANANISVLALLNIFVAGFLLGINYIFTRNIWFAVFLHFSWNFFQGPVFGFEVSGTSITGLLQQTLKGPELLTGGDFGFEGSLLCLLLNTLACVLLASYYMSYRNKPQPGASR